MAPTVTRQERDGSASERADYERVRRVSEWRRNPNLFDPDEGFFEENSLQAIPVDAGLRWNFNPTGNVSPWISGGVSYVFLDISDVEGAEVDDETGWYAGLGSRFGSHEGVNFFGEVLYRATEATVKRPRNNVDLVDHVNIELDGVVVNAGVMWNF